MCWRTQSDWILNLESCKLWVEFKGKILQVNQFTPVGNTMDLFWLMHEVLFVEIVNILWFLVFVFGVFFHCQTKWIYLIVVEWGLWNNSWVKNLPVRPLAPRRKTPGPAVPRIQWPPGLGQKYSKTKYLCWGRVLAVTVSNKLCDYINTTLGINNELTLMIPSSSKTSLFTTVGLWTPLLSYWWIVDQFATSAVLFSLRKKNSFSLNC